MVCDNLLYLYFNIMIFNIFISQYYIWYVCMELPVALPPVAIIVTDALEFNGLPFVVS